MILNDITFKRFRRKEMSFCTVDNLETIKSALCCCVSCGIPLMNFREDGWGQITLFGCGHCGLAISLDNKRLENLRKPDMIGDENETS